MLTRNVYFIKIAHVYSFRSFYIRNNGENLEISKRLLTNFQEKAIYLISPRGYLSELRKCLGSHWFGIGWVFALVCRGANRKYATWQEQMELKRMVNSAWNRGNKKWLPCHQHNDSADNWNMFRVGGLVVCVADLPFADLLYGYHAAYTCSGIDLKLYCLLFGAGQDKTRAVSLPLLTLRCAL